MAVTRAADQHAGDHAHEGKIFNGLVGCTVFSDGDAAVRTYNRNVEAGICDGVTYLLISSACSKDGKCVGERLQADG